jgi:hypothetical protein
MSTLPLTEAILLEIHQSLVGQSCQTSEKRKIATVQKRKFATAQGSIASHKDMGIEILNQIFKELNMDPQAQWDATENIMEFANAYKTVELNTWTFAADDRQIVWMLLGYFYVPGLARRVAFWNLDQAMDKGMPGGRFWYLPELREADGKSSLYLPVAQVVDWLLDLLGMPVEKFVDERCVSTGDEHDGLRRSLYNWRKSTTIQIETIQRYFGDGVKLDFKGAFVPGNERCPAELFSDALDFVKRKDLKADSLRLEIPITQPGCLEAILNGQVAEDVQMTFVKCLADRYAVPTPHTIRQRLLLARAVQDGYVRMLKFLCPGVGRQCFDPQQNKLLQLFAIYKLIYNLTIQAYSNCHEQGEEAENVWFEEHLPAWNKFGLMISILPSMRDTANLELAEFLSHYFIEIEPGAELEDHIGHDGQSTLCIIRRNIDRTAAFLDEKCTASNLVGRMKRSSPWRALQGEHSYRVIIQVAQHGDLSPRLKAAVINRLRELAVSPAKLIPAIRFELNSYLNGERKDRPKDTRNKVEALLDEAEANEAYGLWRGAFLQYKAKHLLACNDFVGAGKLFRQALEATFERNYGPLRGEVARDCFAVELANQRLIVNNHEKYYREMLAGGVIEVGEELPSIEEVARDVSCYFWDTLYKPYPGVPIEKPRSFEAGKKMISELVELFSVYNQSAVQEWIKSNQKLLNSPLPDVEGNSVLMQMFKARTFFLKRIPYLRQMVPFELQNEMHQYERMLGHWRQFIGQLAEESPKQLNFRDLKGQTPLMLAAEDGDAELVKTMLKAGADPDIQDWQGMTALHSAVKSLDNSCVDALLDHPCRLDNQTCDGRSPLHTACWIANVHAVKRLLQMAPELAWQREEQGMTPLELVECLVDNPEVLRELAAQREESGRRCASKQELEGIVELLEQAPPAL